LNKILPKLITTDYFISALFFMAQGKPSIFLKGNHDKKKIKVYFANFIANFISFWRGHKRGNRTVILCYHSVSPSINWSCATPELFESHLLWLKENCHVVPFSKILSVLNNHYFDDKPVVAITFDDGYVDNYEWAFPLLKKHGLTATFFITVGFIEKDPKVLERFRHLWRGNSHELTPLSWEQIREMRKMGMEIGSHTYSHPNLARLDSKMAKWELEQSKKILEDQLGEPVTALAYPFGKYKRHFTYETVEIAQELGYLIGGAVAFRQVRKEYNPLILPRFTIFRDTIKTLSQKIYGAWDWVGWLQENIPIKLAKVIS
jgi:peptidoglycan/xylan/chitin deacetylase (PgdA/CDA1 family)